MAKFQDKKSQHFCWSIFFWSDIGQVTSLYKSNWSGDLFPTIPILTVKKCWNNRFENEWAHIGPVFLRSYHVFSNRLFQLFSRVKIETFWYGWKEETQDFYIQRSPAQKSTSLWSFTNRKSLKLGCPFKLLQKVKPDWQLAADLTDFMFMNPPSLMNIYMGVAKWRYLKIIVFSNTKKRALKGRVQSVVLADTFTLVQF